MMNKNNLLPILRRRRAWIVLALSLAVFFVSCALLSQAVRRGAEQIDEAYRSLEIRYSLSGGRDSLSSGCSVGLHQIRKLEDTGYFSKIECDDFSVTASRYLAEYAKIVSVRHTLSPERLTVLEGALTDGFWLTADMAERLDAGLGDRLILYGYNTQSGTPLENWRAEGEVTAILEGAERVYADRASFDYLAQANGAPRYYFNSFRLTLRRALNPDIDRITREIQRILNGPAAYFENKDVTVDYNAVEVDGMTRPLLKAQASAEFFEKLFRRLLPFAVYLPEAVAVLGLANEIGVRRMLGESFARVFLGVWLPVLLLSLPGYGLAAILLSVLRLTADASWTVFGWHAAGTVLLTGTLTAALAAQNPLVLLRTREDA